MLIQILDAQGVPHWSTAQGQDQINDYSGSLAAGSVGVNAVFQQVMPANVGPPPAGRAGWLFQNTSGNPMLLNELDPTVSTVTNSWTINPGEAFPPCGFPIPTGIIQVMGTAASQQGDTYTCREWVNAPDE